MKMAEGKRLIRPVERQPMREWLIDHLDSQDVPGCEWLDREKGEFHIKWCHGSRHGWSLKDADLFERWAKHTGRFNAKTTDAKKWKANFRCALNSRKDIEEITKKDQLKGVSAYRVYRMKGEIIRDVKPRLSSRQDNMSWTNVKIEKRATWPNVKTENKKSENVINREPGTDIYSRLQTSISETKFQSQLPDFGKILPEFEKLVYGKMHILPKQGSGFCVEIGKPATLLEQLPGISRFPQTLPISHETEIPQVPSPHTYPLTPEDSEASQADEEDMEFLVEMSQEVSEEVIIESSEVEHNPSYIITDISKNTSANALKFETSYSDNQIYTKNIPVTSLCRILQPQFCPLTPP